MEGVIVSFLIIIREILSKYSEGHPSEEGEEERSDNCSFIDRGMESLLSYPRTAVK